MFNDLKLSLRHLSRTPGFAAAASLVLTLGIGLNAVMFSLCWRVAFAPRRFHEPDRLVQLYSRSADVPDSYRAFSYAAWRALALRRDAFAGVLAHEPCIVGLTEDGRSRRALGTLVSANYFDVLGVPLLRGRSFTAEEDQPGSERAVAVASYALWRRTGSDPGLLGRALQVNGRYVTVVGIAPRGFTGTMTPIGPELYFPLGLYGTLSNDFEGQSTRTLQRPDAFNLFLVARLRDGVSAGAATQAMASTARALAEEQPAVYRKPELSARPLPRVGVSTSPSDETALTTASLVFLGMTGAVLLIVCLNLATLLLARGHARRKEFAIRLALGGGRARIVRQLLTEALALSVAGGALGILAGSFATDALLRAIAGRVPLSFAIDEATSPLLVAATALFALLATGLFALGPALRHSRADVLTDLKLQAGEAAGRRLRFLPRHPLVALQVALSLGLLVAAGLFLRLAREASQVELGLRADETVIAEVDASLAGFDEGQGLDAYARIEDRLAALPGVRAAAAGVTIPFGTVSLGREVTRAGAERPLPAGWNAVGASYFDAMGIPLLRGRAFTPGEAQRPGAPAVAVVDAALARRLWPDGDAVGRTIELPAGGSGAPASGPIEVVGVVGIVRDDLFDRDPGGALYVPLAQGYRGNVHFHVRPRAGVPAAPLRDAVRAAIAAEAPTLPLFGVATFRQRLDTSIEYWMVQLLAGFFAAVGAVATLIALVGIYGAKSYAVARRTREIGVRVALGATPRQVLSLVLLEGLRLGAAGVALGLPLGLGVGRVLDSVFVEVVAFDPLTFAVAPAALLLACLLAAWVPARRATAVDPVTALRAD